MQENKASFFERLSKVLAPSDVHLARLAYMMAKSVHRGQVRQELDASGEPLRYFEHLRRATLIAIDELRLRDPVVICTLLLHDSVEDCDLDPSFIEQFFGREVAAGVLCLTKAKGETAEQTAERLFACGDWRFIAAKLCDRLDNMRSLYACPESKRARKIKETKDLYWYGFTRLANEMAPPIHSAAFKRCNIALLNIMDGCATPDATLPKTPPE